MPYHILKGAVGRISVWGRRRRARLSRSGAPRRGAPYSDTAEVSRGRRQPDRTLQRPHCSRRARFTEGRLSVVPRPLELPRLRRHGEPYAPPGVSTQGAGGSRHLSTPCRQTIRLAALADRRLPGRSNLGCGLRPGLYERLDAKGTAAGAVVSICRSGRLDVRGSLPRPSARGRSGGSSRSSPAHVSFSCSYGILPDGESRKSLVHGVGNCPRCAG